jgi:hypothetical protein
VNVNLDDARAFCDWLSSREPAAFRLPVDVEWEWACRAGTTSLWWCGNTPDQLQEVSNLAGLNAKVFTKPVGGFPANSFGLCDMHGNVAELCDSPYELDASVSDASGDRAGTVVQYEALSFVTRRGDHFTNQGFQARSAFRGKRVPALRDVTTGFRVVMTIDHPKLAELDKTITRDSSTESMNSAGVLTSPDWKWSAPIRLGEPINSDANEAGPALSTDGNTLLFNRSGEDGRVDARGLLMATRSPSGEWSSPEQLPGEIGDIPGLIEPHLHLESGVLYLTAFSLPGRVGAADLFVSRHDPETSTWSAPESLGKTVNSSAQDQAATLSADGLTLIFHSDRDGGQGSMDLWVSTRESTDSEWSTPVNAGSDVNSDEWETHPCLSSDGLVLLFVRRETATQSHRLLLQTTRTDRNAPWQTPTRITFEGRPGPSLNSPTLSGDGKTLIFSAGNAEDYDLMISHRVPAKAK